MQGNKRDAGSNAPNLLHDCGLHEQWLRNPSAPPQRDASNRAPDGTLVTRVTSSANGDVTVARGMNFSVRLNFRVPLLP